MATENNNEDGEGDDEIDDDEEMMNMMTTRARLCVEALNVPLCAKSFMWFVSLFFGDDIYRAKISFLYYFFRRQHLRFYSTIRLAAYPPLIIIFQ